MSPPDISAYNVAPTTWESFHMDASIVDEASASVVYACQTDQPQGRGAGIRRRQLDKERHYRALAPDALDGTPKVIPFVMNMAGALGNRAISLLEETSERAAHHRGRRAGSFKVFHRRRIVMALQRATAQSLLRRVAMLHGLERAGPGSPGRAFLGHAFHNWINNARVDPVPRAFA